jgi:hypothetical protein
MMKNERQIIMDSNGGKQPTENHLPINNSNRDSAVFGP